MKTLFYRINLALSIAILCVPAMSYALPTGPKSGALQDSKKTKDELYATFKKGLTGDANAKKASNDAGKEFLERFPDEKDPRTKEIKEWMAAYTTDMQGVEVLNNVYKTKKYPEAFQVGKQVLAADPDNIKILTALGYAGMQPVPAGGTSFATDAIVYAKKAIQLIESGKQPVDWKPFASKDETLGWLNYSLGAMVIRTAPSEAAGYLGKAANLEGAPKKDPVVYYYLAVIYGQDFDKQRAEFETTYKGKPETPESKVALEKVSSIMDLMIDAYARAISYTDANPQLKQAYQQQVAGWMTKLTELYKFRHNGSDSGLKDMIATIQAKPLPGQLSTIKSMSMP